MIAPRFAGEKHSACGTVPRERAEQPVRLLLVGAQREEQLLHLLRRRLQAGELERAGVARRGHLVASATAKRSRTRERTVYSATAKVREDIAGTSLEKLDEAEATASTLPHREKYLMLAHGLSRRMLAAHLEWLDDVERELP